MKRLTLVVTWLLVTAGAMGVAWSMVSRISTGGTDSRPSVLSRAEVESALRQPAPTTTSSAVPAGQSTAPVITTPDVAAAPAVTSTTLPAARTATTLPPVTTTTTSGAGSATTVAPSPTTVPQPPPQATTTSTAPASTSTVITSTGGVATVSCSGSQIRLVSSNPRDGFTQYIERSGPDEVDLRYQSASHRSDVKAQCSNGQAVPEVEERSTSGGDH